MRPGERGVTLIDTIVGISLMLVVFLGIAATFRLSVDVVTNNKARGGAIALADQRMEYIRSLAYTAVGTALGIPSGTIAQSETVSLNGVTYTRRTVIVYADDPKDGTGASDTNGITADYKAVKVDVAWTSRYGGTRHVDLATRISPATGLETNPCSSSCGTLVINVANSASAPLSGASVAITNPSASPAVNFSTFTNASGTVTLLAAPAASGYAVVVTNPGYSTDQTNTGSNPTRSALTVSSNQTTSATFQIDALSSMTVLTLAYGTGAPITTAAFSMHGAKTTNTNPVTYKYSATLGGAGSATTTISNLEWDTYSTAVSPATGYDLAYSCSPQPVSLSAGTVATTTLYLAPHTTNSLSVEVLVSGTGALVANASVRLYKTGYDTTQTTDSCGQTFFSGLSVGTYNISVTAAGHTTYNASNLSVASSTQYQALIN
jgi:hypothetical protein